MKKYPTQFWVAVLCLGWLFDFLFWKHTPGLSFALYSLVTLLVGFILLWREGVHPSTRALLLVPLIVFFAAVTALRREPLTALLAHGLTLFLMAGLVVTYRGGRWLEYSLADYFARALALVSSAFVRAGAFLVERRQQQRELAPGSFWPVVRGILLAIPVLVFFAAMLASADLIFAQRLQAFTDLFNLDRLPEFIFRALYILILAYLLAGVLLHAAERSEDQPLLGLEQPLVPRFLGFTEAAIVLGSVGLLFAGFVLIQFQYFFGGQANIHLDGFTFSEYARRGFGELVAVAFFSLLLLLGLSTLTRRHGPLQQRSFAVLGGLLVTLVGVMLVSAYQRLVLYENAYGFTHLRTYTHVFMIWLAALLLAVLLLEVFERQRAFALAALLAGLGFALSLSLLNVDAFILRQNVRRAQAGQELDAGYLASLSTDAIPALTDLYQSPQMSDSLRDQLGAALVCFQARNDSTHTDQSWQAFHFSTSRADTALAQVVSLLQAYPLDASSTWPGLVSTPLGAQIDCLGSGMD